MLSKLWMLLAVVAVMLVGSTVRAEDALTHTKDSIATVKANLADGKAVIVDVREPKETDEGHLKGAILLPKSKLTVAAEAAELVKKLDKTKIVYTHCRAGKRALECGEILKKQGFDVRPLKTGYEQLLEQGLEKAK